MANAVGQNPKDPKQMSDEELDKALETPGIEQDKQPKTPPAPVTEEEPEVPEEEEPEEEELEEKPPSRRETLRIQQVLAKLKEAQENKPTVTPTAPEALDYEKALEADPETIKRLQEDRERTNQAMYQQGIAQANSIRFHTRLEIDAPRIEAKYPQLDKSDEAHFKPALANAINTMFLSTVGYDEKTDTVKDPNLRYSDYVDSIFELAGEIADDKTAKTTKNVTKQASQTGLRPSGSGTKKLDLNKLPGQMSDEELDAVIARAIPS